MNKIQEEFERLDLSEWMIRDRPIQNENVKTDLFNGFQMGFKAANPLPTTKVCPVCNGKGYLVPDENDYAEDCLNKNCKDGIIQIYYTPEEYKEITGKDYPEDCLVWAMAYGHSVVIPYKHAKMDKRTKRYYIVQTAQPAPEVDYKGEVKNEK